MIFEHHGEDVNNQITIKLFPMQTNFFSLDTVRETIRELKLNVLQNICNDSHVVSVLKDLKRQYVEMNDLNYIDAGKILIQPFGTGMCTGIDTDVHTGLGFEHDFGTGAGTDSGTGFSTRTDTSLTIESPLSRSTITHSDTGEFDDGLTLRINPPLSLRAHPIMLSSSVSKYKQVFGMIDELISLLTNNHIVDTHVIIINLEMIDKACGTRDDETPPILMDNIR